MSEDGIFQIFEATRAEILSNPILNATVGNCRILCRASDTGCLMLRTENGEWQEWLGAAENYAGIAAWNAIDLVTTLPETPANGDVYLTKPNAAQPNKVARYNGTSWDYYAPKWGWLAGLSSPAAGRVGRIVQFLGGIWIDGLIMAVIDADLVNATYGNFGSLSGVTSGPVFADSTGRLMRGFGVIHTAKVCTDFTTSAPTAAPNYFLANSFVGGLSPNASYRGSLKGTISAGSYLDVRVNICGTIRDLVITESSGDFVFEWWLETFAAGADAFLTYKVTTWYGSSHSDVGSYLRVPIAAFGTDDFKVQFKIGNTGVEVKTVSEVIERLA